MAGLIRARPPGLLFVFGCLAVAGSARLRDWLPRRPCPRGSACSDGRLHAPGSPWLLAASQPGFTVVDPLTAPLVPGSSDRTNKRSAA